MTETQSGGGLRTAVISLASSNLLGRGIGLFSSLFVASILQPHDLGSFALAGASAAMLSTIGALGLPPLITREISSAGDWEHAARITGFGFSVAGGLLTFLGLLALPLCAPTVGPLRLPGANTLAALMGLIVWSLAIGLNTLVAAVLAGHRRFRASSWLIFTRALLVGIATMTAVLIRPSGSSATIGAALGEATALGVGIGFIVRENWVRRPSLALARSQRALVMRAAGAGAAALLISFGAWVGQFALSKVDPSLASNGLFLLISRLLLIITLVPNAIGTFALPTLSTAELPLKERHERRRRVGRAVLISSIPISLVVAIGSMIMLPRLDTLYGDYLPAILMMAPMGIAMALNNVLGSVALAERRIRTWILSDWALAGVLIGGSLAFVSAFGVTGLTVAHACAYGVSVLILIAGTNKTPYERVMRKS